MERRRAASEHVTGCLGPVPYYYRVNGTAAWCADVTQITRIGRHNNIIETSLDTLFNDMHVRMATSGNKQAHITTVRSSASLDILRNIRLEKQQNQQQIKCYQFVLSSNLTEFCEYMYVRT